MWQFSKFSVRFIGQYNTVHTFMIFIVSYFDDLGLEQLEPGQHCASIFKTSKFDTFSLYHPRQAILKVIP